MGLAERVSELERKFGQCYVKGKVSAIDPDNRMVRVSYGTKQNPMVTDWLPVVPMRCAKATIWWFPEVGEGARVISPGDLRQGEVYPGRYTAETPAPSKDPDLFLIQFGDGSEIRQQRKDHRLDIINKGPTYLTSTGKVVIQSDAKKITMNDGTGVVTRECICAFTGLPHDDYSSQVFAGK